MSEKEVHILVSRDLRNTIKEKKGVLTYERYFRKLIGTDAVPIQN